MKEIKIGLVGCGAVAPTHINSYKQIPGATVKTICDIKRDKATAMAAKLGVPNFTENFTDMLNDQEIDLIDICTDHASHSPLAIAAMDAGKNVVCEKCLSNSLEGLDAMLAAHKKHPELVFSGIFQHRHEKGNLLLKKLLDRGCFGQILNASVYLCCLRPDSYYSDYWHGKWNGEGGSVLITQVVHFIDLVNYFLGTPESVIAQCDNMAHQGVIETEDNAAALVRYPNGVFATICGTSASAVDKGFNATVIIGGTKGHIELAAFRPVYWRFHDKQAEEEVAALMKDYHEETPPDPEKPHYGGAHPAQLADVVDAVRNHREPYVTVEKAAVTARLILSCYKSAQTGDWINL